MGRLKYYYGAMNAGKSLALIGKAYMLKTQGKPVLLFKCVIDGDCSTIKSRGTGTCLTANGIYKDTDLYNLVSSLLVGLGVKSDYSNVLMLLDECQFLTSKQVDDLVHLIEDYGITINCYGLKNTYIRNTLFEGSKALLYNADTIIELSSECHYCKGKAIMNMRMVDGRVLQDGVAECYGDVKGGDDFYVSVCRGCYIKEINKLKG